MSQDFVLSVALTTDGDWVLSGSKDRGVQFWDPRTGDTQLMLQGHKNSGMLSFHIQEQAKQPHMVEYTMRLLANDCVWNSVISVAPSPKGELFATGSGDMRARIWRSVDVPQLPCPFSSDMLCDEQILALSTTVSSRSAFFHCANWSRLRCDASNGEEMMLCFVWTTTNIGEFLMSRMARHITTGAPTWLGESAVA